MIGEVSNFMSITELALVRRGDFFTFEKLVDAPEYSIAGNTYLGALATETYAGEPHEIMRANGLIYNFDSDALEPLLLVTQLVELKRCSNYYLSPGLILPGSITVDGSRVTDYLAWFSQATMQFKYSEVTLESA